MAITRSQQARQLYRDAGYVQAAYGKAAATPGPVERPTITPSNNTSDGIWIWDYKTNIFEWNIKALNKLGLWSVNESCSDWILMFL